VVDISHPEFEDQIQTVNQTLDEIGAGKKKTIMVFNKMDAFTIKKTTADTHSLDEDQPISLDSLQQSWMAKANNPSIFISALHRHNYAELRKLLYDEIKDMHAIRYPYDNFLY
jgi:GTP-binding protein HflX